MFYVSSSCSGHVNQPKPAALARRIRVMQVIPVFPGNMQLRMSPGVPRCLICNAQMSTSQHCTSYITDVVWNLSCSLLPGLLQIKETERHDQNHKSVSPGSLKTYDVKKPDIFVQAQRTGAHTSPQSGEPTGSGRCVPGDNCRRRRSHRTGRCGRGRAAPLPGRTARPAASAAPVR